MKLPGLVILAFALIACAPTDSPRGSGDGGSGGCSGPSCANADANPAPSSDAVPSPDSAPPASGCSGYATRFWDCCKPHCGWQANVPRQMSALPSCSVTNQSLGVTEEQSSCSGGAAHLCYGLTPFAVSNTRAYGYAATSSGDVCGRCFELTFTGRSFNAPGDPGSTALLGKTMVVQTMNIGFDVANGQFDLLVPGGGVGAFDACSAQWGASSAELGAQYGGLLRACKDDIGFGATLEEYKDCLADRCNALFGSRGLTDLQQGCLWYADWFEAADNPALTYEEVACPDQLVAGSAMDRRPLNDIGDACGN